MGSRRRPRTLQAALWAASLATAGTVAACGGGDESPRERDGSGRGVTIGVIYVGSTDDRGYNQAARQGVQALRRAIPGVRLLEEENVPESSRAQRVMERMIARGARIVIPTSFGHLAPAFDTAARHPRVTFLHMGGLQTARNVGTFFGKIWEAQYAAGQAAGLTTRSDRLGYVAAFPIAQSLLGVNAFQLGARSVNPRVRTRVSFTSSWCDPARQRRAARRLLAWRADVLSQHQDCSRAVIETAAAAGAKTTGFHYDAHDVAPRAWVTGATWNWGPLFVDMVRSILSGRFASSPYAGRHRGGIRDGVVRLARFGPTVPASVRVRVRETYERLRSGRQRPFAGTVRDQTGNVRIPAGEEPGVVELEETGYLVEGVVGSLPRG